MSQPRDYEDAFWPSYEDWLDMECQWTCSGCGETNLDGYGITAEPMCQNCSITLSWDVVLAMPDTIPPNCLSDESESE